MKYLKKFNQHADYETYELSADLIRPNVSWCVQERDVHYNPKIKTDSFNGHEYVDLGLPSGTLWATCNIGSDDPATSTQYFAWGEVTASTDTDINVYNPSGDTETFTKYNSTDGLTELEAEDDAAHVNWGDGWSIPTKVQLQELIDNCTWSKTTMENSNGYSMDGYQITGNNGKMIFLPCSGYYAGFTGELESVSTSCYYLSKSRDEETDYNCYTLIAEDSYFTEGITIELGSRMSCYSIRPVITPIQQNTTE